MVPRRRDDLLGRSPGAARRPERRVRPGRGVVGPHGDRGAVVGERELHAVDRVVADDHLRRAPGPAGRAHGRVVRQRAAGVVAPPHDHRGPVRRDPDPLAEPVLLRRPDQLALPRRATALEDRHLVVPGGARVDPERVPGPVDGQRTGRCFQINSPGRPVGIHDLDRPERIGDQPVRPPAPRSRRAAMADYQNPAERSHAGDPRRRRTRGSSPSVGAVAESEVGGLRNRLRHEDVQRVGEVAFQRQAEVFGPFAVLEPDRGADSLVSSLESLSRAPRARPRTRARSRRRPPRSPAPAAR